MLYIDDATEAIMRTIRVLDKSPTSLKEPLQIGTGTTTTLDNIVTVLNRLSCALHVVFPCYDFINAYKYLIINVYFIL